MYSWDLEFLAILLKLYSRFAVNAPLQSLARQLPRRGSRVTCSFCGEAAGPQLSTLKSQFSSVPYCLLYNTATGQVGIYINIVLFLSIVNNEIKMSLCAGKYI